MLKNLWQMLRIAFAAVGGTIGWFIGGCDGPMYALLAFVAADYVTGVLCAAADKRLSSAVGFRGLCRKMLIFILVGAAHVLDAELLGGGSVLRTAAIFFYVSNEGISLAENAAHLGLPVPARLKAVLEQLHERGDKDSGSAGADDETDR